MCDWILSLGITDNTEYLAIQLFVPTELVLVLKIIQLAAVTPGVKKKKKKSYFSSFF